MLKFFGRKKPYTEIGISRIPCTRCGQPSVHQWQICANKRLFTGCCLACDIALNELVLKFMNIPNADELMIWYREQALRG